MAVDISDLPVPPKYRDVDISDLPVPPTSTKKSFGEKAIEFIEPTAEALGTAGGAVLGGGAGTLAGGPVGAALGGVAGAGLGYGATKEFLQNIKEKAGYVPTRTGKELITQPLENIATGAAYEAGGQALPGILKGAGKLGTTLADLAKQTPETRAAKIVVESLGSNLPEARKILQSASKDLSASQALGQLDKEGKPILTIPTTQALLERAQTRDPEFFVKLFGTQEGKRLQQLQNIAQGKTQTASREAIDQAKRELNEKLIPVLKVELSAANIAGKKLPQLAGEAERMGQAATAKVEDVRRFKAAEDRAIAMARQDLINRGLPVGATKYTYLGELSKRADEVATQAAEGSLRFGEAARFADAAAQSLEAHGLRPLKANSVISALNAKLKDPAVAGNRDLEKAVVRVGEDIAKWTNNGGVIDAFALDSIRKNSVNAVAKELFKDDAKAQKRFASEVLSSVRPVIVDAIEKAGGTGYKRYLEDYARGSQVIAQTKFGSKLMALYESNPKEFVKVVEGNKPEDVEKVFGPGSYNLFKEISANTQSRLTNIANEIKRDESIKQQAAAGTQRLADVLKTNLDFFRLPHWFSKGTTLTNDILSRLESSVSDKTLKAITEASKTAKSLDELIARLPPESKKEVLKAGYVPTAGATLQQLDVQKEKNDATEER
jgi:hypothetical protein